MVAVKTLTPEQDWENNSIWRIGVTIFTISDAFINAFLVNHTDWQQVLLWGNAIVVSMVFSGIMVYRFYKEGIHFGEGRKIHMFWMYSVVALMILRPFVDAVILSFGSNPQTEQPMPPSNLDRTITRSLALPSDSPANND